MVDVMWETLDRDGVVILPERVPDAQLALMRRSFAQRVSHRALNHTTGYHASDPYRRIVEDVLLLDAGFVQAALHPQVLGLVRAYLGAEACLTEAKGWRSRPTRRDVHGWHADAWYDRALEHVPRQLKLGVYLSDVQSGAFQYLRGSQGQRPVHWSDERAQRWSGGMAHVTGEAGTMFVFDSSGVHRQECPVLQERDAVFFVYHDPAVPLQAEDVRANRYHAARVGVEALGGLSVEQLELLGLGRQELVDSSWRYQSPRPRLERATDALYGASLWAEHVAVTARYALRGVRRRVGL